MHYLCHAHFRKKNSKSNNLFLLIASLFLIGQFNLGFLVCSLEIEDKTMIFIIDQHAADEKYNYETLFEKFQVSPQQLVQ